jgi:hypothetical protein
MKVEEFSTETSEYTYPNRCNKAQNQQWKSICCGNPRTGTKTATHEDPQTKLKIIHQKHRSRILGTTNTASAINFRVTSKEYNVT